MIHEVFEFNSRCLQVKPKPVVHLDENHRAFCVKAIREEAQELEDANHGSLADGVDEVTTEEDRRATVVAHVDALIDAAYFAIGGMARAGLTKDQAVACMLAVHGCNMAKKMGIAVGRGDMGVADAIKPAKWVGPEDRIYKILFGSSEATEWDNDGEPINDNPLLKTDSSETIISRKG